MSFVIGVDIGTGSTKAVLTTLDGTVRAVARRDHAPSLPQPGWAEMDPERDWWGDVVEVLAELDTTDVAAVCVSGLGPCVVQTDDDLRPRRPAILYGVDTRSTREIAEITEQLGAGAILERCGKDLSSQAIGPKLAWLRRAAGYAWQPQDRWFSAHTYVVARLTGRPFFNAAVDAFVLEQPPASGDLNVYGDALPAFLGAYAPAARLPYLADVAALEWAIDEANRAADVPRAPAAVLAALAAAPVERLPQARLALDPSCRMTASPYPILRIWRANQPDCAGDERIDLDEGGAALLVRRDPPGVALEPLAPAAHAWLLALAQGETLGAAIDAAMRAEPGFDLGATLRAHVFAGTIVGAAFE